VRKPKPWLGVDRQLNNCPLGGMDALFKALADPGRHQLPQAARKSSQGPGRRRLKPRQLVRASTSAVGTEA
jgi:hypothetical protein